MLPALASIRVLLIEGAATPPGVVALLAEPGADANAFQCLTQNMDVLRNIGSAPDADSARHAAVAAVLGVNVVVVSMQRELVQLAEPSVAAGIATLADVGVPVMLLTDFGHESPDDFNTAATWIQKHVRAVLSIDCTATEFAAALSAVHAGLVVVDPQVSQAMFTVGRKKGRLPVPAMRTPGEPAPLSAREREVLALLAEGLATKNIAHELGISAHTVKAHVESIFAKFGATTRAEAVAIGVRRGAVLL